MKTQIMQLLFRHRLHSLSLYCDKVIEFFFYALVFFLPISKAVIEISAAFIIVFWIIKKLLKPCFISTYLDIPLIIYILAVVLSVIFSNNFALSLKNFFTKTMEYIILYFAVAEFISTKTRLKNTCLFMLTSGALIGIDCLFQYFFGFDFLRFRHLEAGRITASFQMPGDMAGYLGPLLCLPLSLGFLKFKRGIKYFLIIESILLLSLLFTSLTRGAWIGFIVAACLLGILENKKILYVTVAFLLILGIVAPQLIETSDNILGRLKSIFVPTEPSNLDRKAIWQVAIRMVKDKPVFGLGLSTFMGNFSKYGKDYYYLKEGIIPYAHNCYLQLAAETGIVGLMSFLILIGTFFIYTMKSLRKIKDKFYHAVLSGISAGIIVTLVHSVVDTNLYSLQLSVLFWIMLGINAAIQRNFAFEKETI